MNKANYRECPTCQGHLYSIYIGGIKLKLENKYYCKICKNILEIEFTVFSHSPNNKYGNDLKSQNQLIEELQIEEERVFN